MAEQRTFELGGKPLKDIPDAVLEEALQGLSVIPEWRQAIQQEQGLRARYRREPDDGDCYEDDTFERFELVYLDYVPGP